jgi:sphingomyelin phosphodiesterase
MYDSIKTIVPDATFMLFTGDIVDHAVWNTTEAQNILDINDAYNLMAGLGKPVFGTIGNHESSPTNAFPPTALNNNAAQWVYDTVAADWQQWIGAGADASVQGFGSYSVQWGTTNLRIISINTNMYYVQNYWLYTEPMEVDPSGQFAWLVTQLDAAEKAGERAYILGHMAMGLSDAFHDYSFTFDEIVNRYSNTIAGLFFGHTHADEFEVSYSNYGARSADNAVAVQYLCPSLTPTNGMPAFRVYTVDPDTWAVLDHTTYIADMTNEAFQTTGPVWTEYYSARDAYAGIVDPPLPEGAELSPAFWHDVSAVFATDDDAFNGYIERKSRNWDVESCTGTCQTNEVCQIQSGQSTYNCVIPAPGVHFSKREEVLGDGDGSASGHGHTHGSDECGGSVLKKMLWRGS